MYYIWLGLGFHGSFKLRRHIGKTEEQQMTEDRELNNFTRVLKLLISQDAYCREIVEIVDENNQPII